MTETEENSKAATTSVASLPPSVPMSDVLGRIGHELGHLARLLEHLQNVVGPLVKEAAGQDVFVLHHVQSFDDIGQRVAGLSDFIAALAPATPCDLLVDPAKAADCVKLADLADRLGFRDKDGDSCATACGELEMF